jgi:hypothetical protein
MSQALSETVCATCSEPGFVLEYARLVAARDVQRSTSVVVARRALLAMNTPLAGRGISVPPRAGHAHARRRLAGGYRRRALESDLVATVDAYSACLAEFGYNAGQFLLDGIRAYTGILRVHVFPARLVRRVSTGEYEISWRTRST